MEGTMKGWTQKDVDRLTGKKSPKDTPVQKQANRIAKELAEREFSAACKRADLPLPVKEHKFHPDRKWRFDYYFSRGGVKVALEIEGGVWTNGRHTRGKGFIKDMEKYNAAQALGIYVVRCIPSEKFTAGIKAVKAVFDNLSQGA
jgi:hypothetical protein